MIKNNIAFALRCVGGVVVIGGVSWSLYALLGGGTWFQPFLFFVVSVVLGSIVWGISEIINLHAQQIDIQLRLEEKLRKLVPCRGTPAVQAVRHPAASRRQDLPQLP